jgi:hypothetical protein
VPSEAFYSFDTSAIINGRRDIFLPETFGVLWNAIEEMVLLGTVRAVDEVRLELGRKSDEALAWAKSCKGLFVPLSVEVQQATSTVLARHPKLIGMGGGSRNAADPFVIGLALAKGGTVVTQETARNRDKPKIPDVCMDMGIPWQSLPEFVNAQRWQLSRS